MTILTAIFVLMFLYALEQREGFLGFLAFLLICASLPN